MHFKILSAKIFAILSLPLCVKFFLRYIPNYLFLMVCLDCNPELLLNASFTGYKFDFFLHSFSLNILAVILYIIFLRLMLSSCNAGVQWREGDVSAIYLGVLSLLSTTSAIWSQVSRWQWRRRTRGNQSFHVLPTPSGVCFNLKTVFPYRGMPAIKLRWFCNHCVLVLLMEFPILVYIGFTFGIRQW